VSPEKGGRLSAINRKEKEGKKERGRDELKKKKRGTTLINVMGVRKAEKNRLRSRRAASGRPQSRGEGGRGKRRKAGKRKGKKNYSKIGGKSPVQPGGKGGRMKGEGKSREPICLPWREKKKVGGGKKKERGHA